MTERDWVEWHEPYDRPESSLSRRLALVQHRIREVLDSAPPGPIRVVSMCAGQARDLLGALEGHHRRTDVIGRFVERDGRNVAHARTTAAALGIELVEIVEGDASTTSAYATSVPADLILVCGVFGNVSDADIHNTVGSLPLLCRQGGTVIWTRHRRAPDATPQIRAWFSEAGFAEVAFDSEPGFVLGVGTHRLTGNARAFVAGVRLFDFVGDGTAASL